MSEYSTSHNDNIISKYTQNTHTTILCTNWIRLLVQYFSQPMLSHWRQIAK